MKPDKSVYMPQIWDWRSTRFNDRIWGPWTSRDEQTPTGIIFLGVVVVIFMKQNNVTTCDGIENQQNKMPIYAIESPLP